MSPADASRDEATGGGAAFERWRWRVAAWALAAVNVYVLPMSPPAFAGFSLVYPALWITHRTARSASTASLVVGVGITARLAGAIGPWSALLFGVLSTAGSISIGLWLTWIDSLRERTKRALADKEEALAAAQRALDELATAQEALVTAEREAAASAERQRWAHEVHDTLAQSFVSLITLSQVAASTTGEEANAAQERIIAISREGLREARTLIAGDQPAAPHGSLHGALAHLCRTQTEHGGLVPLLDLRVDCELPVPVESATLRVVQEALTNVRRHARATQVSVEVEVADGELVVRVEDDGVGLQGAPEGTGLTGMRRRLENLGGSLTVDPASSPTSKDLTGTLLEARIPV